MPSTRAAEDPLVQCEIKLAELQRRYNLLQKRNQDLESLSSSLSSKYHKLEAEAVRLRAALNERAGAVSFMPEKAGMWSKETDVLVSKLSR